MPKRSTSKKRAAELEKEIDMENKEATTVEDMEMILPDVYKRQKCYRTFK